MRPKNKKKRKKDPPGLIGTLMILEKAKIAAENVRICKRLGRVQSDLSKKKLLAKTNKFVEKYSKSSNSVVTKV